MAASLEDVGPPAAAAPAAASAVAPAAARPAPPPKLSQPAPATSQQGGFHLTGSKLQHSSPNKTFEVQADGVIVKVILRSHARHIHPAEHPIACSSHPANHSFKGLMSRGVQLLGNVGMDPKLGITRT